MRIDRRTFLETLAAAAAAGALNGLAPLTASKAYAQTRRAKLRVGVLAETAFPSVNGALPAEFAWRDALPEYQVEAAGVDALSRLLASGSLHVLVTPHGSAFPLDLWPSLQSYLARGGNWVNVGGEPLAVPVVRNNGAWQAQVRQTAYHKLLGITQSFPVPADPLQSFEPRLPEAGALTGEFSVEEMFALYVRLTTGKEFPDEDGSYGPRDAVLTPLIHAVLGGMPVASPFLVIDRLRGRYAGGRWVLAPFRGSITAACLRALVDCAAENASEFRVRPSYARYRPGESVSFAATLDRPGHTGGRAPAGDCSIEVNDALGNSVGFVSFAFSEKKGTAGGRAPLPLPSGRSLPEGFYHCRARATFRSGFPGGVKTETVDTGFWVVPDDALAPGKPFSHDGTYLIRGGAPYPVTGTTYMASDVHRRFLLEPDPHGWNRDFAAMAGAGVNVVRTGIWSGWSAMTAGDGTPKEEVLRALDAFLLAAQKNDIAVIFTFFAFLPHTWGGENPYCDPRAVAAQKVFLGSIARRYAALDWIIWDLINEPSFCNAKHLWQCRPKYDSHEKSAWEAWLRQRYPVPPGSSLVQKLCELWKTRPEEGLSLPALQDFEDTNIPGERRPGKVMEYRLFAQEMFSGWVREMTGALRSNGNAHQLITVGQDEGGTGESPSPLFHAATVDLTSVHTWWLNDDLLWDGIVTKTPGTPNLVEETGVMFYERADASAWRTEEQVARLLERKLALAFAGGSAGYVEWIWNTNPYMDSENEAAIGLLRADGTAKPEFRTFTAFTQWIGRIREHLRNPEPAAIAMVVPQSLLLSVRNQATAATRTAVRALAHRCGMPVRAVGEYQAPRSLGRPSLIVLPSPTVLSAAAWEALMEAVRRGSTLLVTGHFDDDEHGLPSGRMAALGFPSGRSPVHAEEVIEIDGRAYRASFRGDKLQRIEKGMESDHGIRTARAGEGAVIWSPLPLELNEDLDPVVGLYRMAAIQARLAPLFATSLPEPAPLSVIPTLYAEAALYTILSDADTAVSLELTHKETGYSTTTEVPPGGVAMLLLSRKEASEFSRYPHN